MLALLLLAAQEVVIVAVRRFSLGAVPIVENNGITRLVELWASGRVLVFAIVACRLGDVQADTAMAPRHFSRSKQSVTSIQPIKPHDIPERLSVSQHLGPACCNHDGARSSVRKVHLIRNKICTSIHDGN